MLVTGLPPSASWQDLKVMDWIVGYYIVFLWMLVLYFMLYLSLFAIYGRSVRITCAKLEMSAFLKFFVTVEVSRHSNSLNKLHIDVLVT